MRTTPQYSAVAAVLLMRSAHYVFNMASPVLETPKTTYTLGSNSLVLKRGFRNQDLLHACVYVALWASKHTGERAFGVRNPKEYTYKKSGSDVNQRKVHRLFNHHCMYVCMCVCMYTHTYYTYE